jgi:hypothetical protein
VDHKNYKWAFTRCNKRYSRSTQAPQYIGCFDDFDANLKDHDEAHYLSLEDEVHDNCASATPTSSRGNQANTFRDCIENTGFDLTPAEETQLANLITAHCDGSYYTGGKFADFNPYWTCFSERRTSFSNDASWKSGVHHYCADSNMIVNKLSGYKTCISQRAVAYVASDWQAKVKTHCDGSYYTGGRQADYNAYWACYTERGTTFVNDNGWKSDVRNYCADSNMVVGKLNGYKTCLSQRQVSYDVNAWTAKVKTHCDGSSYSGSRFQDYGAYWNCFSERGTSYVNDNSWKNGVRSYCANSNAGIGYNGNITCLNQRQVSYYKPTWCAAVKTYCDAQVYIPPFSTNAMCQSERNCP